MMIVRFSICDLSRHYASVFISPKQKRKNHLNLMEPTFSGIKSLINAVSLSRATIHRLRANGELREGVHYVTFSANKVLYNLSLCKDFVQNRNSPQQHEKAIADYLRSVDRTLTHSAK